MARPVANSKEDVTHNIRESGGFTLAEKKVLEGIFKRGVMGKVLQSDQTVASSTTLTSVSDLSFVVKKGKKYRIHAQLMTNTTGATGGIKVTMTHAGQSSPTLYGATRYLSASAIASEALTSGSATGAAVAVLAVEIDGIFIPDASGTITLQFAQNTSNGTGAVIKAGSYVNLYRAGL